MRALALCLLCACGSPVPYVPDAPPLSPDASTTEQDAATVDVAQPVPPYCRYPADFQTHPSGDPFKLAAWPGHEVPITWKMWDPWVIWDEDDHLFKVWYTVWEYDPTWHPSVVYGAAGKVNAIAYATSSDGITWTRNTKVHVILPEEDQSLWDSGALETVTVLKRKGTYYAWFCGYRHPNGPTGPGVRQVGMATSSDGVTWTKNPDPVVTPTLPFEQPFGTTVTDGGLKELSVIWDEKEGLFKLWYVGFTRINGNLVELPAYATSPDGISWTKLGTIKTGFGGSNHMFVIKDPAGVGYQLYSTTKYGIGQAWSLDGITSWIGNPVNETHEIIKPVAFNPVKVGERWTYDVLHAYGSPAVVYKDGTIWLYYMQTKDDAHYYGEDAMRFGLSTSHCTE